MRPLRPKATTRAAVSPFLPSPSRDLRSPQGDAEGTGLQVFHFESKLSTAAESARRFGLANPANRCGSRLNNHLAVNDYILGQREIQWVTGCDGLGVQGMKQFQFDRCPHAQQGCGGIA